MLFETAEVYLKPCQISQKSFILNVWQDFKYVSGQQPSDRVT